MIGVMDTSRHSRHAGRMPGSLHRESLRKYPGYGWAYALMLPGVLYLLVFRLFPMYGLIIAFKSVNPFSGWAELFFGGEFVGFRQFERLFRGFYFLPVLRNTLSISLKSLVFGFPAPLILAILLNEVRSARTRRLYQTISYLPHFLSWIVVYSIVYALLNPSGGLLNEIIRKLGGESQNFLANPRTFQGLLVSTQVWQSMGWGSIIYLAALTGIDPGLYEAARIDGARKWHEIRYITIPGITHVIVIVLILRMGRLLEGGFEQVLAFYSPPVYEAGDIIDTYVYREGLINFEYSYATAAGLFKSAVGLVLVLLTNKLARRMGEVALW